MFWRIAWVIAEEGGIYGGFEAAIEGIAEVLRLHNYEDGIDREEFRRVVGLST